MLLRLQQSCEHWQLQQQPNMQKPMTGMMRRTSLIICLCLGFSFISTCLAHLRIGAFNIRVVGRKKTADLDVLNILVEIVQRYDILLIQEIRDKTETAIDVLVDAVNADIGTDRVTLTDIYQYNDSAGDVFQREPFCVRFQLHDSDLRELALIGIHTDPDEAVEEMDALVDVHEAVRQFWGTDNILIMGDLNADCRYASNNARERLKLNNDPQFRWLISDDVDTTTTNTDCTYDRFIASGEELKANIVPHSAGVFRYDVEYLLSQQMAESVSDHYPIEVLIRSSE